MHKLAPKITIAIAAIASIAMFTWPLFIATASANEASLAQGIFIGLMPMILILVLVEFSTGGIDSRQLALLGVLSAINAVVRLLGAGTGGIETAFFIIIISAYVFGASFGFILGSISLMVSALLVGGVGPWLPFQMMAAGLVGLGSGLLPKISTRWAQILLLAIYAVFAAFVYGALMTLWNWPFLANVGSDISYSPGSGIYTNLLRFVKYEILTGGLLWDAGRAVTSVILIAITAPALLTTLKRAASKAGYEKVV